MKLYLCYVYTPTTGVPHLVAIRCESPALIPGEAQKLEQQWPQSTAIEVFEDDRLIWSSPSKGVAEITPDLSQSPA